MITYLYLEMGTVYDITHQLSHYVAIYFSLNLLPYLQYFVHVCLLFFSFPFSFVFPYFIASICILSLFRSGCGLGCLTLSTHCTKTLIISGNVLNSLMTLHIFCQCFILQSRYVPGCSATHTGKMDHSRVSFGSFKKVSQS